MSSAVPIDISYQRNSQFSTGPQRFRRESVAHSAGIGGVSWGGMSVGSWLREEVLFHNANNNNNQVSMSPVNTASYLPTLEADFCKDYSCCGQVLPTLHDLLRHYEEAHISPSPPVEPPVMRRMQSLEAVSTNEVFLSQMSGHGGHHHPGGGGGVMHGMGGGPGGGSGLMALGQHMGPGGMAGGNGIGGHHGMHGGVGGHGNIAGGNLGSNNMVGGMGGMPGMVNNGSILGMGSIHGALGQDISASHAGTPMLMDEDHEMCIDDPARHLYVMERGEHKPFKCPVQGCEKTYKNQNGLKYHRMHGHQNQTLHLNDDGTYSIVDPLSNTPYPEGMGMEKDKPYRCEVCGKRYKNLNGLKYHRGHSTH